MLVLDVLSTSLDVFKLIFVPTRFIQEQEKRLQRNYEGEPIREYFTNGNIDEIHCHKIPIRKLIYGLKDRKFSVGYTQITILLENTLINEDEWEMIEEKLEEKSINVEEFGPDYQSGGSYLTISINGFNAKRLENAVTTTTNTIHNRNKLIGIKNIPPR